MEGDSWFVCSVMKAGPAEDGRVYIWLRDLGGKFDTWFFANPEIRRDALSVAIVAIVNGIKVEAALPSPSPQAYTSINRIYLSKM